MRASRPRMFNKRVPVRSCRRDLARHPHDRLPGRRIEDQDDGGDLTVHEVKVFGGALSADRDIGVHVIDEGGLGFAVQLADQVDAGDHLEKSGETRQVARGVIRAHEGAVERELVG